MDDKNKKSKSWVCRICGYVHQGDEPPNVCPLCEADKDQFAEIE